jgi:hypothetical protein
VHVLNHNLFQQFFCFSFHSAIPLLVLLQITFIHSFIHSFIVLFYSCCCWFCFVHNYWCYWLVCFCCDYESEEKIHIHIFYEIVFQSFDVELVWRSHLPEITKCWFNSVEFPTLWSNERSTFSPFF